MELGLKGSAFFLGESTISLSKLEARQIEEVYLKNFEVDVGRLVASITIIKEEKEETEDYNYNEELDFDGLENQEENDNFVWRIRIDVRAIFNLPFLANSSNYPSPWLSVGYTESLNTEPSESHLKSTNIIQSTPHALWNKQFLIYNLLEVSDQRFVLNKERWIFEV